ncbi:IS1096 element passenger TnpR family protein [Halarsenatibacter silvermanii]|uniref:PRiA4b ORF-3-like protein n=1 Tax=Halarsenatibacter silvermanii TaxID=321763 RepID=A0A1G9M2V5_9FIRM|nr:hypothetical protein [Halarsenatibacter silvermanii]SDL68602.1 pRiA4b ORF-3-like protein [Halarsenatibacter silvermanii]
MGEILQLKVKFPGTGTCKRFLIESEDTFQDLHEFLFDILGRHDRTHLHEFIIKKNIKVAPEENGAPNGLGHFSFAKSDEGDYYKQDKTKLAKFLMKKGQSFIYRYDFGDDWRYDIILEKMKDREYIEEYDEFPVKIEDDF